MKKIILLISLFFITLRFCGFVSAEQSTDAQTRFGEALENTVIDSISIASIVIENRESGDITLLGKDGFSKKIGTVLIPAKKWNEKPFEATEWAPDGVCAVAVNAIHIKDSRKLENYNAPFHLISLLPREMIEVDQSKWKSYYNASSSIYTDISAGTIIFGGLFTPFVGAKVEYEDSPIPSKLTFDISIPDKMPLWISFENRFGGLIKIKYPGMDEINVGIVYRPVYGVGRFTGTLYCEIGRIRAIHTGVIDVSTSPYGEIGGFQIVPHFHADTTSVRNVRLLTQWMVIGPLDSTQQNYGDLPLILKLLQPRYVNLDVNYQKIGTSAIRSRFHVVGKFRNENQWRNFPPLVEKIDDALENLEEIRIYFPFPDTYQFNSNN